MTSYPGGAGQQFSEVGRAQWRAVSGALADAFYDDPVFGWLLPNDATRARALRRLFAIETRHVVLAHGRSVASSDQSGIVGAALVLPPGRWRTPLHVQAGYGPRYVQIFGRQLRRAAAVLWTMERRHPRHPHMYLPYIGVAPGAQGSGRGSALLAPILDRCDRDGMPAYLEASNPRCARLYERLGFGTLDEIQPFGAPPIQLMSRAPA